MRHNKKQKFKKNQPNKNSKYKSKQFNKRPTNKRKFGNQDEDNKSHKKPRHFDRKPQEAVRPPPRPQSPAESSESEAEDFMKQLCSTFGENKSSLAIESSESEEDLDVDDEDVEEEEEDINEKDNIANSSNDDENEEEGLETTVDTKPEPDLEVEEEDEIEIDLQEGEVDVSNSKDPFEKHCLYEISENLLNSVQQAPTPLETSEENWPELGRIIIQIPKYEKEEPELKKAIIDDKIFAPAPTKPHKIDLKRATLPELCIKNQIKHKVAETIENNLSEDKLVMTPLQGEIFSVLNNYQDFYYGQRSFKNAEEIRFVYCFHAMNHILKTRSKVIHHNAKVSKHDDVPDEYRDQGLVRPKVLIIAPFRDAAYKIINNLIEILIKEDKGNVANKLRFIQEFTGGELIMPKKNPKPEDYEILFSGNSNDDFKIGISVTKKSLKLYADFYSSDIIVASPLGIRYLIGAEGEKDRDYDFLASIEMIILDQTEIFMMQNWDHLLHVFDHLHQQPKKSHGTNFLRVRTWNLNGWGKYYRQTIIFSSLILPEINSLFNKKCFNYAGRVRVLNPIINGSLRHVCVQMPHVYQRFDADSMIDSIEARFNYFVNRMLPQLKSSLTKQTLIFISNYFDYVRLRNYFKKEDIGFVQICEYSKEGKVARARDMFFHGDAHFLMYTERFHFFNRKRIKGIRHIVFYQPPMFPDFYYELCNFMQDSNMNRKLGDTADKTVSVLYSKYDVHQLSAIIGTDRAGKMITSDRSVHMLLTD